jgi:hypothetical protein
LEPITLIRPSDVKPNSAAFLDPDLERFAKGGSLRRTQFALDEGGHEARHLRAEVAQAAHQMDR